MDRSIEIAMQRKLGEKVERLGRRDNDGHAKFRQQCLRWANDNRTALPAITVKAPDALNDRAFDAWEPLLVIAERVGGDWPKLAVEAATALSGGENISEERAVELLADIKAIFGATGDEEITTKALVAAICAEEERPWATWNKGHPISDRQVAKLLKQFPIISEDVRPPGQGHAKGYKKVRFLDYFERYLTSPNLASPQEVGPQACERANADETGITRTFCERAESDLHGCEKREKPANEGGLHACTDTSPQAGGKARSGQPNSGNGAARFRSDFDDACEELRQRGEVCGYCGKPGDVYPTAYGDRQATLHRACRDAWAVAQSNGLKNQAGAPKRNGGATAALGSSL